MPTVERPADVLGAVRALGERVRPVALARERNLPVHPALSALFPDGGLHRGTVIGCEGRGARSLALALTAAATEAGAWAGIVGLGSLAVPAAVEMGVAVERVFRVTVPAPDQLVTVMAAVIDGVEVVLATGAGVRAGDARRLAARLTARGAVLVLVGPTGGFSADVRCEVTSVHWEGLEAGAGRLTARRAIVESSGRRADRRRRVEVWFPGADGKLAAASPRELSPEQEEIARRAG